MSVHRRAIRRAKAKSERTFARPPIATTLFEFAKPMMDSMPTPRQLAHIRAAMALATLAWNLPLLERDGDPTLAKEYRDMVTSELAAKPAAARELVLAMMRTRLTRWAEDNRLISSVEVIADGRDIKILATEGNLET